MNPNTARHVLRIAPDAPLTADLVEAAFTREVRARHPSLYPDAEGRAAAQAWAGTLESARTQLLTLCTAAPTWTPPGAPSAGTWQTPASSEPIRTAPTGPAPGVAPTALETSGPEPRGRRSRGVIIGLAAGGAALALATAGAVWGISAAAPRVIESIQSGVDRLDSAASAAGVERYFSGETLYTFPAALEIYSDDRYGDRCDEEFAQGCWQMALFTEQNCTSMEVVLAFSNHETSPKPQSTTPTFESNVEGNTATVIVFGDDDYDYAWISEVICHDEP